MTRPTKTVTLAQLQALIEAGAISAAFVIEDPNGQFQILCRSLKGIDHQLRSKRGEVRVFRTIDTAARLLRNLGIVRIRLHLNDFAPGGEQVLEGRHPGRLKDHIEYHEDALFSEVRVTEDVRMNHKKPTCSK